METLPENDRVRYTISPDARKEEAAVAKARLASRKREPVPSASGDLFE